jgi:hypothetical protein
MGAVVIVMPALAWLSENPRIKIVDTKLSASGGSYGPSLWLISIWYEEGAAG